MSSILKFKGHLGGMEIHSYFFLLFFYFFIYFALQQTIYLNTHIIYICIIYNRIMYRDFIMAINIVVVQLLSMLLGVVFNNIIELGI